ILVCKCLDCRFERLVLQVVTLSGAVKFAGEMTSYDKTHGTITVVTEEGNRDVYLREAFVIG
ncbi:hypothetical protein, partial [Nostoc sp. CALU 1950]|uniref:hypothetical protein n=1 Tax=Nostoc sp. CALU 1950 TaxID=3104321 RepID=UPI003EBD6D0E